jgi:hypothetical protein
MRAPVAAASPMNLRREMWFFGCFIAALLVFSALNELPLGGE